MGESYQQIPAQSSVSGSVRDAQLLRVLPYVYGYAQQIEDATFVLNDFVEEVLNSARDDQDASYAWLLRSIVKNTLSEMEEAIATGIIRAYVAGALGMIPQDVTKSMHAAIKEAASAD
jgi:hypothetical protein